MQFSDFRHHGVAEDFGPHADYRRRCGIHLAVDQQIQFVKMRSEPSNHARACVKTPVSKFGNDQILAVSDFDERSRRIEWSEIEFSHSLALQRL